MKSMQKVKIKDNDNLYYIEPDEDNINPSAPLYGDSTKHFMYKILDEGQNIVGCVTFSWTRTARAVSNETMFKTLSEEELTYLALIPYLPINIGSVKKLYSNCFMYVFGTEKEGFSADGNSYSIRIAGGMRKNAQRLIFGNLPTPDQIRRQILVTLHSHWLDDQLTSIPIEILQIFVPVDKNDLLRNVRFLVGEQLISSVGTDQEPIISVKIENPGIKYVEDQSEFSTKFKSEFIYQKFMGDNINTSTSGNNSPVIIKSQNISIAFEEIEAEIKTTNVTNKQEILVLLDQLKQEVTKQNDPEKVKGLLGEIKKKGSWLNDKILSHPLLAQIIAQTLLKAAGL